jgi:nucleoside phosphorylase
MKRRLPIFVLVAISLAFLPAGAAGPRAQACHPKLLVLSAFPAEIGPALAATKVSKTVVIDGRAFFLGTLKGNDVVLALTGIGLKNADHTTRMAFDNFGCGRSGFSGIVFSGVSGGRTYIGDVTIPARWTIDDGKTWSPADPRMLSVATTASKGVALKQVAALGDCACLGLVDPDAVEAIAMPHKPQILIGGKGRSSDPFIGNAFPCIPGSGDVFGCQPCKAPRFAASDIPRFVQGAAPFLTPDFFTNYFKNPSTTPAGYDADDEETAAIARVAAEKHVPFIGFRALSDGLGDPLHLFLGFPFQFLVYRQYAADNAGVVELAFLAAWPKH